MWLTWLAASLPGGHRHRAVGLLEGQHVVHSVARHGHGVALGFQRAHEPALLVRGHAAEHGVFLHGGGYVLVRAEFARVHIVPGPGYPGAFCHLADGHGVVAGDDLYRHALPGEIFEGVGRLGAYLVREQDERNGQQPGIPAGSSSGSPSYMPSSSTRQPFDE